MMGSLMGGHYDPNSGSGAIPGLGVGLSDNEDMPRDAKDVLAANLKALMASREDRQTLTKITAAGGGSNGTLDRIRRGVGSTSLAHLQQLAASFGLEPWQLLVPQLDPENLPELALSQEQRRAIADARHLAAVLNRIP